MSILSKNLWLGGVAALLAASSVTTISTALEPAYAQQSRAEREEEDRRRRRQTLSERSGRALNDALNLANEEPPQIQAAIQRLDQLLARNVSPYDEATALEIRGNLHYQNDNSQAALRDLQRALDLDVLPSDREKGLIRGIAGLYYQAEQFDRTISFMQAYIRDYPDEVEANDYFILAGAFAQQGNYRAALRPAEQALAADRAAGSRSEQYYSLLNLIYSETGEVTKRLSLLEQMVEYFPSQSSYWSQLAFMYAEADRRRDALAVLEVSYKAGLITDEDKIINLAQFYYDQNNPYRGAVLLDAEMRSGTVKRTLSNLELLAQLWAAAQEQERAIAILTEAAPKRDDGRLYYQLGQSYLANEEYDKSVQNLRQAIRRGGLDDREVGNAYVLIGTALFQQDSESKPARTAAKAEFQRAVRYSSSRSSAQSWIEYINTIETTLERQAQVEFSQAVARTERQIERCQTILDVIELGGSTQVPEADLAACRDLLAKVEAGATAESLVRGEEPAGESDEETPEEEAADSGE
ncbi:tetratricopeptide repeat protein [Parvularcula maris]|uniref:Tetratricopeptide repeat protein n=1 Tax=Parvularcula maris TaxID=2965077 RepID=A0A9X2L9W4_9PROT|nr:tetratricopeptide repeat protein [Parvularcula maris]MCQ8185636.1 tetratricopeptide repeat protein [Parvularcula maris]